MNFILLASGFAAGILFWNGFVFYWAHRRFSSLKDEYQNTLLELTQQQNEDYEKVADAVGDFQNQLMSYRNELIELLENGDLGPRSDEWVQ